MENESDAFLDHQTKQDYMANLPDETITTVFNLQRRLWELINKTTATAWIILEQYSEIEAAIPALEELDNVRDRPTNPYSRLHILLLRIGEAQPTAPTATLDLLAQTITQAQATIEAGEASIQETKRDLNLP